MSSTNKTNYLHLNQWLGTDVPQREDFVADNDIIDRAIRNHATNSIVHVTQSERDSWNQIYYKFTFSGDGSSTRVVETSCPFQASWGIIFANSCPPSVVDIDNNSNYNYFGVFSNLGSTSGVSIVNGNNLKVYQSSTAVQRTEYRNYNQNGTVYTVIMFR